MSQWLDTFVAIELRDFLRDRQQLVLQQQLQPPPPTRRELRMQRRAKLTPIQRRIEDVIGLLFFAAINYVIFFRL